MTPGGPGIRFDTINGVLRTGPVQRLGEGVISVQAAKMAIFLSLAVATALGSWYLGVRSRTTSGGAPRGGPAVHEPGQFGEAEREFATAVALARFLGEDDPREALSLSNQADALVAQSRFDDAIPLFQRALEIDEKVLGPDHPDVAPLLEHFAVPLRETGRIAQAEAAEKRVRCIHARSGRGHKRGSGGRKWGIGR